MAAAFRSLSDIETDDIICQVADRLVDEDKVTKLGKSLKLELWDIERYNLNNNFGGRFSSKGTKSMLRDWTNTKKAADFWPSLRAALSGASMDRIVYAMEEKFSLLVTIQATPSARSPNNIVTESELLKLASAVTGSYYVPLAVHLGLSTTEHDNIWRQNSHEIRDASYKMLLLWKGKGEATYTKLDEALEKAECGGKIDEYKLQPKDN